MDEQEPKVRRMATWVEYHLRRTARYERDGKPRWLILTGPTGTGKTHALKAYHSYIERHAVDCWEPGHWQSPPTIFFGRWIIVGSKEREAWDAISRDIRESSVVVLDDLGIQQNGRRCDTLAARLQGILDVCERKWCMFTTNIPQTKWVDEFGSRVADRLRAAMHVSTDGAKSYRCSHISEE